MPLDVGTPLGPYKITALVGVGGMGEVYRATDTKLGRAVAIKVLPETFARQDDRRARFQREAQLLASLNHPNRNDRSLVAVTVSGSGNDLEISKPTVMLEIESDTTAFDVTPDGQSFLLLRPRARERVSLIFNWPAEMARIAKESAAGIE